MLTDTNKLARRVATRHRVAAMDMERLRKLQDLGDDVSLLLDREVARRGVFSPSVKSDYDRASKGDLGAYWDLIVESFSDPTAIKALDWLEEANGPLELLTQLFAHRVVDAVTETLGVKGTKVKRSGKAISVLIPINPVRWWKIKPETFVDYAVRVDRSLYGLNRPTREFYAAAERILKSVRVNLVLTFNPSTLRHQLTVHPSGTQYPEDMIRSFLSAARGSFDESPINRAKPDSRNVKDVYETQTDVVQELRGMLHNIKRANRATVIMAALVPSLGDAMGVEGVFPLTPLR